MNEPAITPTEAIAPLLRQVEELRLRDPLIAKVEELQALAWHLGYVTALDDFRADRPASANPYDFDSAAKATEPSETANPH